MIVTSNAFNTLPSIIHAPDVSSPIWKSVCRYALLQQKPFHPDPRLTIITWNNLAKGCFETSLELHQIPYRLMGSDIETWSNYYKFDLNLKAIDECQTPYIMGCDSHDVVLIREPSHIIDVLEDKGCKLLFNAECMFYPPFIDEPVIAEWKRFQSQQTKSKFAFLNAGAWIGKTGFCKEFFTRAQSVRIYNLMNCEPYQYLKQSSIGCDQSTLHHLFREFFPDVQLDYKTEAFFNIANINHQDVTLNIPLL